MKTIVFAASKGGTGKTTLAFAAGVEAAKHGTVYLADVDPQKSLQGLCERRGKGLDLLGDNPMMLDNIESIIGLAATLERTGYARDFLVVDTPGSFMKIIREAISGADCIVLPVQPSVLDILAQEDVARIVTELDKTKQTLLVLNRIDGRIGIDDTLKRITPLFPNPVIKVHQRINYSRALIAGRTGSEIDKECAKEIAALWAGIEEIIGRRQR